MRRARLVLVLLLAGAVGLVLLTAAARQYLGSAQARAVVTARLEAVYGGPVRVAQIEVGLHHSALADVRLYEPSAEATAPPWAVFADVQAEVSALALLRGEARPRTLTVRGAAVTLRFDPQGHLLTRLPLPAAEASAFPAVHLERGQLTLHQEGYPDLVLTGIEADFQDDGTQLVLQGTVADPDWGTWSVHGTLPRSGSATLLLQNPGIHLTQTMLDRLPFVAPKVWQHVQVEGDTPVALTLRLDLAERKARYRLVLEPKATRVHIPAIHLHAEQAHGQLVIEDKVVQLQKVSGQTAGGTLQTSGVLNFRDTPAHMHFAVEAHGLELARLPKQWSLPSQIRGRWTGQANLQVTLVEGKAQPQGEGQGVIHEVRIAGLPARPIHLGLQATGSGFRFLPPQPSANGGPVP
jgi:hypothetical protein